MGYIGVTDREWFYYLKESNIRDNVNFWRKNINSFKVLSQGDKFFFLVKNKNGDSEERGVIGYGIFREYIKLTIDEAWEKYKEGNGFNSKQEFIKKMSSIYMENLSEAIIGCIILDDIKFFENEVFLSELNIDFSKSIVSGKGISIEEDLRIIEQSKINAIKKVDNTYEKEVISIPARHTIELIYKYSIHAHPNELDRYKYKNSIYYTFRESGGVMKKLYTLKECIILNPKSNYRIVLNNSILDEKIKNRIINYIEERRNTYGFASDGNYKIYILNETIRINGIKKVLKNTPGHMYFTIEDFLNNNEIIYRDKKDDNINSREKEFLEGKTISIKVNKYERNVQARKECLKYYGYKCSICGFDFKEYYGDIGNEIIEVHHRKALSEIKEGYLVDPIKDLVPVCSNCHTVLHSRKPYYSVEELKIILRQKRD